MYDSILFPTDGSDGAAAARDHALAFADRFDATLHALYVVDANRMGVATLRAEALDELEDEGATAVDAVAEAAAARGVDAVTAVEQGTAHEAIVAAAAERDVDLVVMGTHGRSGLDRYLLGSVTEKVVRTAPVPVFTASSDGE